MAELTFRSPGVSTREIDLTGPTAAQPSGIPAAVVGTANRGPAFVPVTVATFQDFVAVFGETDGEKFGPLAMREWLRNAGSAVYVRTLGAGDGRRRDATDGFVTRAGFVVGEEQVQADGIVGPNTYADGGLVTLGRTYFLGAYMSESAGSTVFSSAGLVTNTGQAVTASVPIIRGVVMAPSGVALSLGTTAGEAAGTTAISGTATGSVNLASNSEFAVLLNGHVSTARYKNVITASFDPTAPNYFSQVFNTNPDELEAAGHYLYSHYDIWPAEAVVTGTGVVAETASKANIAFVLTGTTDHNSGSDVLPDYEEFRDRYRAAFSPWFISQAFGGKPKNLFKVHALTDGASESSRFKVSISNIAPSTSEADQYGHFDLLVRDFGDTDTDPVVLERFSRLSLNPASDRYAPRVVGDRYVYFDWDKKEGDQRIIIEGSYPNSSRFVRLEMADEVDEASIDPTALPVGFRGHHHLLTSGSYAAWTAVGDNFLEVPQLQAGVDLAPDANYLARANQPPVPMRLNINVSSGLRAAASNRFYWGTQFEVVDDLDLRNKNTKRNRSIDSFTKYFPLYHTSELNPFVGDNAGVQDGGTVFDSDRYNNNLFTLERVAVRTGSNGAVDVTKWVSATYARDAVNPGGDRRFLTVADDFGSLPNRSYIKFSTFVQAGFDGLNAFNEDKREMTNNAIIREFGDSAQGESDGPTIRSYRKAIEILGAQANADIQLLAIPGIRHQIVTDFAIDEVEDRFDAFYIMDVSEYDNTNSVVTSSLDQTISVNNTVDQFSSRNIDTSFAAAYFPDVIVEDPTTATSVVVPPSVAVLGAFSLNDSVAHPWFAPAGFSRGALQSVEDIAVKLNRDNMDALQDADVNPLVSFPGQGPVVFGQKTLLQAESALDRVNVRRLLIDIRRKVRGVANTFVFEPARAATLQRFSAAVNPILANVQAQQGLTRFRVVIDTTTTTQADIENNTIRGKIFLQPTRSVEFVSLDFVVTNAGAEV